MARIYKSAKGKMIDMDKVKISQETVNSVGNMRTNARGDLLGSGNSIATGRNKIMDQIYAVPDAPYSPNDPTVHQQQQNLIKASKAQELHDIANNLTQASSPEPVQQSEAPVARGSLAAAAAKPVTVNQQPGLTPQQQKKANGPSRI
jgi:hypothetical protein